MSSQVVNLLILDSEGGKLGFWFTTKLQETIRKYFILQLKYVSVGRRIFLKTNISWIFECSYAIERKS